MTKVAVIDSQIAGIAGDMLLSAFVDAGASSLKVSDAIYACQDHLKGSKISKVKFAKIKSHGFSATRLQLLYKDGVRERSGTEMQRALARCCDATGLDDRAKIFARESLKTIISAEAKIHGEDVASVHLHEASSIDTLADIMGCATALQDLGLLGARIFSTSVAVGGGLLKFSHGTVPNPASAILEIFRKRKFVLVGGQASSELTTPTGAAMLVNLAHDGSTSHYPSLAPESVGYGAGMKEFEAFPNVVRLVIGSSKTVSETSRDTVCVVETNIDDASGELVGNLVERLSDVTRDVTVISGTTKKSRPTFLIRIITEKAQLDDVLEVLFSESGTLGARVQEVERYILPRAMLTVPVKIDGNTFHVHVKVAKNPATGRIINVKPEFEDIRIIASRSQMAVKKVQELVSAQVMQRLG
jgi:uncharacterized protein (TIGR00299 family) protein